MDKAILKVYPAKFWYDDVVIIGNKKGLLELKQSIETALTGIGTYASAQVQETDGCEYNICSKMHNGDLLDEVWLTLPMHYDDGELSDGEQAFLDKFLLEEDFITE